MSMQGLLKVLDDFPWAQGGDGQVRAYTALVLLMAALVQEKLVYHIPGVESNDVMYAGDPEYQEELIELTHSLVLPRFCFKYHAWLSVMLDALSTGIRYGFVKSVCCILLTVVESFAFLRSAHNPQGL